MIVSNKDFQGLRVELKKALTEHMANIHNYRMAIKYGRTVMNYEVFFTHLPSTTLGKCDDKSKCLLLDSNLIDTDFDTIFHILLHEVAHAIQHQQSGSTGHDIYFRKVAKSIGCKFYKSEADVGVNKTSQEEKDKVAEKIKKLMALSASSNYNESNSALSKANDLISKYNIKNYNSTKSDMLYAERYYLGRKKSATKRTLVNIITACFNVYGVYDHTEGGIYIQLMGEKANMEIATYAYEFLDKKIPALYKETGLSGHRERAGFVFGFKTAFVDKMTATKEAYTKEESTAIVLYKQYVQKKAKEFFFSESKLTSAAKSNTYYNKEAYSIGKEYGKKTSIHPGVRNSNSVLQLT